MNRIKIILSILQVLFTNLIIAQTEYINTDRPDQSDGVYTVPKFKVQLEEGPTLAPETFINNFMLRFGLTSSTEARISLDYGRSGGGKGLMPVTFSVKQRLIEQKRLIPAITFVAYLSINRWADKDFRDNSLPYEVKLAFENELTSHFTLGYNIGTADHFHTMNLTLNLGYSPMDQFSAFIEYFPNISSNAILHNVDIGLAYAPLPQLQFDLACARPIGSIYNHISTTFGVSYIFR